MKAVSLGGWRNIFGRSCTIFASSFTVQKICYCCILLFESVKAGLISLDKLCQVVILREKRVRFEWVVRRVGGPGGRRVGAECELGEFIKRLEGEEQGLRQILKVGC